MDINNMILAFSNRTLQDAINSFIVELNDGITNSVREYLDKLPNEELYLIQEYLSKLLNLCYNGELYYMESTDEERQLIDSLPEKELFLLKQYALYFSGRLSIEIDLDLLKKVYQIDDNKFIKLNVVYSTLLTFDEEIEMDFVNRIMTDPEYDLMIRSWSIAFFKKANNPYEYIDNTEEDWAEARIPRLKRLAINDENNPKYKKAMAYRLIDLAVIFLYKKSRNFVTLHDDDKEIIKNTFIDYQDFSETKKDMMKDLIEKIIL